MNRRELLKVSAAAVTASLIGEAQAAESPSYICYTLSVWIGATAAKVTYEPVPGRPNVYVPTSDFIDLVNAEVQKALDHFGDQGFFPAKAKDVDVRFEGYLGPVTQGWCSRAIPVPGPVFYDRNPGIMANRAMEMATLQAGAQFEQATLTLWFEGVGIPKALTAPRPKYFKRS